MKQTLVTAVFLLAVGVLAALGMWQIASAAPEPPRVEPEVQAVLPVEVRTLSTSQPPITIAAQGRLAERSRSPLVAEASGRLAWVLENWAPGLQVTAGTPLWKLDDTDLRLEQDRLAARRATLEAQLQSAYAREARAVRTAELEAKRVAVAAAEVERWQGLVDAQRGTQSALDQARSQLLAAQRLELDANESETAAELEAATLRAQIGELDAEAGLLQERLTRLEGKAPIDGLWLGSAPAVGEWVVMGQSLGAIQSKAKPRVLCTVGERDWTRLAVGQRARLLWPHGGPEGRGRLIALGTEFDTRSGQITVELEWLGDPPAWRPGQSIDVRFAEQTLASALWVPSGSIAWRGGRPGLYLFVERDPQGHQAQFVAVELGAEQAGRYPVRRALDETVLLGRDWIAAPIARLFDGAPVERRDEESTP